MLIDLFYECSPVEQALIATIFTWLITALGAALVFMFKRVNIKILNAMLGFAAGVMIAASVWSLLIPSIELSAELNLKPEFPAVAGFISGGIFLWVMDKTLPHLHIGLSIDDAEGIKTGWKRSILLVLAITLHNIPEGLAIGVAFGATGTDFQGMTIEAAMALAFGIGIQNFPEGAAVAMPLRRDGFSKWKSFFYGQLSGLVEPIAGTIGALAVTMVKPILPYALSFAAGAMIYVVVEELIPESHMEKTTDIATIGTMLGFVIMMFLDISL